MRRHVFFKKNLLRDISTLALRDFMGQGKDLSRGQRANVTKVRKQWENYSGGNGSKCAGYLPFLKLPTKIGSIPAKQIKIKTNNV